jgi:hypothetical protein
VRRTRSTIDILPDRIASFETQIELAASSDFPADESRPDSSSDNRSFDTA